MVSTIRFYSFKEISAFKAHPFSWMVTAILVFSLVASRPKVLGFIIFLGYLISGPLYTLFSYYPAEDKRLLRDKLFRRARLAHTPSSHTGTSY